MGRNLLARAAGLKSELQLKPVINFGIALPIRTIEPETSFEKAPYANLDSRHYSVQTQEVLAAHFEKRSQRPKQYNYMDYRDVSWGKRKARQRSLLDNYRDRVTGLIRHKHLQSQITSPQV